MNGNVGDMPGAAGGAYGGAGPGATRMHVVYVGESAAAKGLQSRVATPVPYSVPEGGLGPPFAHTMQFDAGFESGNLLSAVQRGDFEYDLFLRADLHTEGHTQWFYFAVTNTHPPALAEAHRRHVEGGGRRGRRRGGGGGADDGGRGRRAAAGARDVQHRQPDQARLAVQHGHEAVMYVRPAAEERGAAGCTAARAWATARTRTTAWRARRRTCPRRRSYFTLSFTIDFHTPTTRTCSRTRMHTYSDHKHHLSEPAREPAPRRYIKHCVLCPTLGGHDCDLLTITEDESAGAGRRDGDARGGMGGAASAAATRAAACRSRTTRTGARR